MPEGNTELSSFEPPKFHNERPTVGQRLKRRLMQFVQRSERGHKLPLQAISPEGIVKAEKKVNPERAKRMRQVGCAWRSIMSAAAFAAGVRNISSDGDEFEIRDNQMKKYKENRPEKYEDQVERIEQDIIALFNIYKENAYRKTPDEKTALGHALENLEITHHKGQTIKNIKDLLLDHKQIMIYTPNEIDERTGEENQQAHIFHAGLDKKNRIISLSDPKITKRRYYRPPLSKGPYTIFTISRQEATVTKLFPEPQTIPEQNAA